MDPSPSTEPDDQRMFELLDGYLAALHAGDERVCEQFLAAHPQFCQIAQCLQALEELSVKRTSPALASTVLPAADRHFAATIPPANGSGSGAATAAGGSPSGDFGRYELLEEI